MKTLINNAWIINEGRGFRGDVLIHNSFIEQISETGIEKIPVDRIIDAEKLILIPGVIDDQVHFREPGLTHKANIATESTAAVCGGITSFMEMPNTRPPVLTQDLLEEKYIIASQSSLANYSFYMGTSVDNYEELMKTPLGDVCGIKIFMGSSTGNMLVDDEVLLERIFSQTPHLIAVHCENDAMIRAKMEEYIHSHGKQIPPQAHALIRDVNACYQSSSMAVSLARKHNTRLHVLHISTGDETHLFDNSIPLSQKRITSEVCVHHLWFSSDDYGHLGNLIKCNPSIKEPSHRQKLWTALLDDRLDVVATDHAPHTLEEKSKEYSESPSGIPLVQHALLMMLEKAKSGEITIERLVEKMCHAPADCFRIQKRGYIKEGYYADLVLIDPEKVTRVTPQHLKYKCGWSPFMDYTFSSSIHSTFVNGNIVYQKGKILDHIKGMRLRFNHQ